MSLSNSAKEEWHARISKLRKTVDELFCKKFGEYSIIPYLFIYLLKLAFVISFEHLHE